MFQENWVWASANQTAIDMNPLQLCCLPCWGSEKSTTLLLPLMGGLSTHLQPPAQGQRKDSGSEVASSSASSCWASLRANFGFQSSFASNPKPSVCPCPCLPNRSSLSLFSQPIVWVWICCSFQFGSVRARAPTDSQTLQMERHKMLKQTSGYIQQNLTFDCIFWGTKGHNGQWFQTKRHCCKFSKGSM